MNNTINEVKNRVYEAEGLLELLQLRPDKIVELAPLVRARLDEAVALFAKVANGVDAPVVVETKVVAAPDTVEASEPETFAEPEEEPVAEPEPDTDAAPEEDDELLYSIDESDEIEETEDSRDAVEAEQAKEKPEESKPASPAVKAASGTKHSPAFCLNDRFRFRRAIFGGSDAEFNSAMNHIATLDNYEEAEEFFYGDMGLDAEDEDVADFMAVIRNYYGS